MNELVAITLEMCPDLITPYFSFVVKLKLEWPCCPLHIFLCFLYSSKYIIHTQVRCCAVFSHFSRV